MLDVNDTKKLGNLNSDTMIRRETTYAGFSKKEKKKKRSPGTLYSCARVLVWQTLIARRYPIQPLEGDDVAEKQWIHECSHVVHPVGYLKKETVRSAQKFCRWKLGDLLDNFVITIETTRRRDLYFFLSFT